MEVREYVKERERMFNSLGKTQGFCDNVDCWECPFWNPIEQDCDDDIERRICAVEKWSKEHPLRTYFDALLEAFPNLLINEEGVPDFCVQLLGADIICDTDGLCTNGTCYDCWNREYKEDK